MKKNIHEVKVEQRSRNKKKEVKIENIKIDKEENIIENLVEEDITDNEELIEEKIYNSNSNSIDEKSNSNNDLNSNSLSSRFKLFFIKYYFFVSLGFFAGFTTFYFSIRKSKM